MENVSYITAVIAGILSFISPCVLPLIPAYVSYISGVSLQEMKSGKGDLRKLILNSIAFVIGFSIVFVILGASATFVGKVLARNKRPFEIIAGIIIVIFGMHTMQVIRIGFLAYEKKVQVKSKAPSFLSALVMGFAFSFGWTPCVGPILGAILIQASTYSSVSQGIFLLCLYSLGLGIPFILTAIAVNRFFSTFRIIRQYFAQVEMFAGMLITGVGFALIFGTGLHSVYIITVVGISIGIVLISLTKVTISSIIGLLIFILSLSVFFVKKFSISIIPIALLIIIGMISLYKTGVIGNERIKET